MKIATIEKIKLVQTHPNADSLEVAQVLGYKAIVPKGQWKAGDLCVFIHPDTVLPDNSWTAFYKAKSSRVKALQLRGIWSFGIVEKLDLIGPARKFISPCADLVEGEDVSDLLGVKKYEAPAPQEPGAEGPLPHYLRKSDEERYQSIDNLPYGELVDVTLKIDGRSMSVYYYEGETGVTTRILKIKPDCLESYYIQASNQFNLVSKITEFCHEFGKFEKEKKLNLALRGELYGKGVSKGSHNPHTNMPLKFALYGIQNLDTYEYAGTEDPYYYNNVGATLDIPRVPMLERQVVLTPELIKKYDEDLKLIDGSLFEGVVIKCKGGFSFKVINKHYDAKK